MAKYRRPFISGDTSIAGRVLRVGGATEIRCALRVTFQERVLSCVVANIDVAKKLANRLYEEVAVQGSATWLKNTWQMVNFTIKDVHSFKKTKTCQAFEELREAGGKGWDAIEDPQKYLEELSGN
jgi:hypothetical protein